MKTKIKVNEIEITIMSVENEDYISLTDIARKKNSKEPRFVVINWLKSRNTIEFLGLWEIINNSNFNRIEFDTVRTEVGLNSFIISPSQWIEKTNAIGIITKSGKYDGGTFAHKDIALEFASWISVEFKLFLIKEFQRLKEKENNEEQLDWNLKRALTKINYAIHTDAIKTYLIPKEIKFNENLIYATEADILNLALFGITAKNWKKQNSNLDGNLRDYADITQLVCLSNLENFNSLFIKQGLTKEERLRELNKIATAQMTILVKNTNKLSLTK